mgnify:FL=1
MGNLTSEVLRLYVGGFNPGTSTTSMSATLAVGALDPTSFGDPAERVAADIRQDRLEWAGWLNDATGGIDKIMGTLIGTLGVVVSFVIGTATGARSYNGTSLMTKAAPVGNVKELVKVEAEWRPDGALDVSKHFGEAQALTAGTASGSVDDAAASTAGVVFYTHVIGFVGTNTYRMVLEDSADGASFADIATADHTGTGGARTVLAGAVRRYIRMTTSWATTGGGTATGTANFFGAYARG